MPIYSIVVLLLIGLLGGFFSGLAGLGGGVIMVPLLTWLLGVTQQQAQGISIGVLVFPVGALAFYNYYTAGQVDFKYVGIIVITFILGSFFGSKIALVLPVHMLKKIFAVMIIIIGCKMLFLDK